MARNDYPIDDILYDLAQGATFVAVARDYCVPAETLREWLLADPTRAARYKTAREERGHRLFDELDEVMTEAMDCRDKVQIQAYKLKIDTLKWKIAKLNPKEYADKQQIEHSGAIEQRSDDQVRLRLDQLLAKAQGREA